MAGQSEVEGQAPGTTTARAPWNVLGRDLARWAPPYAWVVTALWLGSIGARAWALGAPSSDYDEGVYWASLRAMAAGHPLYSSVFSSQPPLFLGGVYPLYLLFGQTFAAARAAIILYSLLGMAAIWLAAWALGGRWCGALALALLAFAPRYLIESYTLQAEAPSLAFAALGVALAIFAARQPSGARRRWLAAAAGAALALGVAVKLFDVVALVPVALYLLTPAGPALLDADGKPRRPERAALVAGLRAAAPDLTWAAGGAVVALALVALPFAGQWPALYDQVVRFHLAAGRVARQSLADRLGVIVGSEGEFVVEMAAIGLGAWALAWRRWMVLPPAAWLLTSLAFLLSQQPLLDHHVALLMPPAVLTATVAAVALLTPAAQQRQPVGAYPVLVVNALLFILLGALLLSVNTLRHAAQATNHTVGPAFILAAATTPGDLVVADDQYLVGLADRDVPPALVDTSFVRVQAGYLSAARLEAAAARPEVRAVVFFSGRFDRVPGFRAWVTAHFTLVRAFGPGQAIYLKLPHGAPQPA